MSSIIPPVGASLELLRTTTALLVLSWATVIGRLSVRKWLKPEAMGLDDHMMCVGLVLYSVTCGLVIASAYHGAGRLSKYLTEAAIMQGAKIFYIAEFFYAACTVPIKSSICICLVRIADSRRRFLWPLWGLVAMQVCAAIIFIVAIGNICHPVTAFWGETEGECSTELNSTISFFFSAVSILTDISLAVLPAMLLWPIQMKRRLKFSVAVILGMAACASTATIIRLRYLTLYNDQAEFMYSAGPIGLWSVIEEGIGIIAGSLPALRPLLNLPLFGGRLTESESSSRGCQQGQDDSGIKGSAIAMGPIQATSYLDQDSRIERKHGRGDSDGDSQRHILKETSVTVSGEPSNTDAVEQWRWRRVNGWKEVDA